MVSHATYTPDDDDVFRALAHGRRRAALRILDRITRAPPAELAAHLVSVETEQSLMDVTRAEAEEVQATLRHAHLPRLASAGLVTETDGAVETTDHRALDDPAVTALFDAEDADDLFDCLADGHRRAVLAVLYRSGGSMDRSVLVDAVADAVSDDESRVTADLVVNLHHNHLPKLDAAGLVSYDAEEATATYEGHADLDEEWVVSLVGDTPRPILSEAAPSSDIWTIDGRENVIAQGQSLFDEAEDELFLMITTDGLLEEECILKLRDAIERGVDVYVGSQTTSVRDVVRERLPEVVIWEPQMDWMALPPTDEKVGRLLFADREAVMIGTLGAEGTDGVRKETALTGVGTQNPLVMLLREMLGSRLDHLDEQSADFRSQMPL